MDNERNELLCKYLKELKEGNIAVLDNIAFVIGKNLMFVANGYFYNEEDAKDAVQTFYYNLIKKAKKFKYDKNVYAWLMIMFRNELKNKLKKRKREKEVIEQLKYNLSINNVGDNEYLERYLIISDIFDKLTSYEKALVEMKIMQQLPFNYIAKILHKPESTVRNHFEKIKEKIKNI